MTIRSSLCNIFDLKYFKNLFRRSWSYGFIMFIAFFASMPVPLLMNVNSLLARREHYAELNVEPTLIDDISDGFVYFWIFVFAAFALIGGIMTFDYIIKRKKAYLYHSMPQSRATHYCLNIFSTASWFFIALLLNVGISLVIFAANGVLTGGVMMAYMSAVCRGIMYFLLTLSIMALCASLTGDILATLAMVLILCFLPVCVYLSFENIIYYNTVYSGFEGVSDFFVYISPFIRVLLSSDYIYTTAEFIITLAVSLLIFVGAYFVYKYRRIESAGTPVIHVPFGETLKYIILFPLSFFVGWVFEAFGNMQIWLFFGFFFGAFVGFVFINLFLYRNPSKMFYRFKGLLIFMAAFIVFFTVFGYNLLHHDRYVPKPNNVKSVAIYLEGSEYEFRDKELVEMLVDYSDDMIEADINSKSSERYYTMNLTICTKLGFTYHKRVPIRDWDRTSELYTTLYESDEYDALHIEKIKKNINSNANVWFDFTIIGYSSHSVRLALSDVSKAYLKDLENPDRLDSMLVCTLNYGTPTMNIYSADKNVLELIAKEMGYADREEMLNAIREFAELTITQVYVVPNDKELNIYDKEGVWFDENGFSENGGGKVYTGEQAKEIFRSLLSACHTYADEFTYANACDKYTVYVAYEITEELYLLYNEKYAPKNAESKLDYYGEKVQCYNSLFREGSVPSFVEDDFSSVLD